MLCSHYRPFKTRTRWLAVILWMGETRFSQWPAKNITNFHLCAAPNILACRWSTSSITKEPISMCSCFTLLGFLFVLPTSSTSSKRIWLILKKNSFEVVWRLTSMFIFDAVCFYPSRFTISYRSNTHIILIREYAHFPIRNYSLTHTCLFVS